jgi:hypothetical protein
MYAHLYMILRLKAAPWVARRIMIMCNPKRFFYFGWKKNILWMVKQAAEWGAKPNRRALVWVLENNFAELIDIFGLSEDIIIGEMNVRKIIQAGNKKVLKKLFTRTQIVNTCLYIGDIEGARRFYKPGMHLGKHTFCSRKNSFEFVYYIHNVAVNHNLVAEIARCGNIDVLKFLMDRGFILKKWGSWLMKNAIKHGNFSFIKFLEKQGLETRRQCYLDTAIWFWKPDVFFWLYDKGLNVRTKKIFKQVALESHPEIDNFLIKTCADYYKKPKIARYLWRFVKERIKSPLEAHLPLCRRDDKD